LDRFRTQKNSGIHSPRTCWCSWFDTGTRCHTYTSTAWLPTACMTWSACRKLDHACQQHTQHNTDNQQPQPPDCHTKKRSSDTRRRGATQTDTCVHVRRQRTCRHTLCVQPYVCMHHRQQSAQRLALARADRYCHYCVTMITQLVCIGTEMRWHAQCDSAGLAQGTVCMSARAGTDTCARTATGSHGHRPHERAGTGARKRTGTRAAKRRRAGAQAQPGAGRTGAAACGMSWMHLHAPGLPVAASLSCRASGKVFCS